MTGTLAIKSLGVQNTIMISGLCLVLIFGAVGVFRKRRIQIVLAGAWLVALVWFFHSPYWRFSAVTLHQDGMELNYGLLSFKDTVVPLETPVRIESTFSGFPKPKKLYCLIIGEYRSMRVTVMGHDNLERIIQELGVWKKGRQP